MQETRRCLVIGCGFAGSVTARCLAEAGVKVVAADKRSHIGGNCFDERDKSGIYVHKYGPHIFHTKYKEVYSFISRFTNLNSYKHKVAAFIDGRYIPVPFNLRSSDEIFGSGRTDKLIKNYGYGSRVGIFELLGNTDPEIREIAEYIYKNIFFYYTKKQWGTPPESIDRSVTARIPVKISYDDGYFDDPYQGIPNTGYAELFENILNHENIELRLNTDISLPFDGYDIIVYTGELDALFGYEYGRLSYRTLDIVFERREVEYHQPKATVNYTVSEDYTRITEYKHFDSVQCSETILSYEYAREYTGSAGEIPYYPIPCERNELLYEKYKALAEKIPNFYFIGRLAQYKYYNMDEVIRQAIILTDRIIAI